jgi:hypothetical protein
MQLLRSYWPNVPIEVFSDGADEELASILQLPNVSRANYKNAVADLVAMTRAIWESSFFKNLSRSLCRWRRVRLDRRCGLEKRADQTLHDGHRKSAFALAPAFVHSAPRK